MNKSEMVARMAEEADIPRGAAERALNAFEEAVKESLQQGDRVSLIGFGSFSVAERKARMGRNPKTGEPIEIPPSRHVKFVPSEKWKKEM